MEKESRETNRCGSETHLLSQIKNSSFKEAPRYWAWFSGLSMQMKVWLGTWEGVGWCTDGKEGEENGISRCLIVSIRQDSKRGDKCYLCLSLFIFDTTFMQILTVGTFIVLLLLLLAFLYLYILDSTDSKFWENKWLVINTVVLVYVTVIEVRMLQHGGSMIRSDQLNKTEKDGHAHASVCDVIISLKHTQIEQSHPEIKNQQVFYLLLFPH